MRIVQDVPEALKAIKNDFKTLESSAFGRWYFFPLILNILVLKLAINMPVTPGPPPIKMSNMDRTVIEAASRTLPAQPLTPSWTSERTPDPIDLNRLIIHPGDTILVRHRGLSMINAFIPKDAFLLVDTSIKPENNTIVLASVNGKLMIRYLKKNDYKTKLVPANPKYPETEIRSASLPL